MWIFFTLFLLTPRCVKKLTIINFNLVWKLPKIRLFSWLIRSESVAEFYRRLMCCLNWKNICKKSQVLVEHMTGNESNWALCACTHCLLVVIHVAKLRVKCFYSINFFQLGEFLALKISFLQRTKTIPSLHLSIFVFHVFYHLKLEKLVIIFFHNYTLLVIKEEIDKLFGQWAVTPIESWKPF